MHLADFDYELPQELVAQFPLPNRSASKLLVLDRKTGAVSHTGFNKLPEIISQNDLLVFNNTKVIPARLFATKQTGGVVEILVERIISSDKLLVQIRSSKSLKVGTQLTLSLRSQQSNPVFEVISRNDNFFELSVHSNMTINTILETFGQIPLPPYIERQPDNFDKDRYQTIYAKTYGAVAAPTAGLHFDERMMNDIKSHNIGMAFLTLHVGAGTFQPIRTENIEDHKMHGEYFEISHETCDAIKKTKHSGGRVIAVGTTSARAIETSCMSGDISSYSGDTNIFIYPGYKFRCIDAIITNFHLPKTSLMLLVCAFAGRKHIMNAYKEAIAEKYRFFSYGDSMIIM